MSKHVHWFDRAIWLLKANSRIVFTAAGPALGGAAREEGGNSRLWFRPQARAGSPLGGALERGRWLRAVAPPRGGAGPGRACLGAWRPLPRPRRRFGRGPRGWPRSRPALRRPSYPRAAPAAGGAASGRKRLCGGAPPPQVSECGPQRVSARAGPGVAAAAAASEPRGRAAFCSVGRSGARRPRVEPSGVPRPRGSRPLCARGARVEPRPPCAERLSRVSGTWESRSDAWCTRNNNMMSSSCTLLNSY